MTQSQIVYGIFVFLVGFFDGVDGAVARLSDRSTRIGGFTDSIVDKVCEVILLIAIVMAYPMATILGIPISLWVLICMASWLLTSYTRSRAENLGVSDLDVGLGARSERLFILSLSSIILLLFLGVVIITGIGILTAAYRFSYYGTQLKSTTKSNDSNQHV